jgi:hypothetical protein
MEKNSWTDCVRNGKVLPNIKEERNILQTVQQMKANWIGHMLRRKYLLKHAAEGRVEIRIDVTGRQGRRWKQRLADLKETRGYGKLIEETLDCMV